MTSAQVVLRWHVQTGVIALPKSSPKDRMRENLESADVELTADEMASIDALGQDVRLAADPDDIDVDRALLVIPEVLPRLVDHRRRDIARASAREQGVRHVGSRCCG